MFSSWFDYNCQNSLFSWNSDHVVLNHETTRVGGLKIPYILRLVVMLQTALHSSLKLEFLLDFAVTIRKNF